MFACLVFVFVLSSNCEFWFGFGFGLLCGFSQFGQECVRPAPIQPIATHITPSHDDHGEWMDLVRSCRVLLLFMLVVGR